MKQYSSLQFSKACCILLYVSLKSIVPHSSSFYFSLCIYWKNETQQGSETDLLIENIPCTCSAVKIFPPSPESETSHEMFAKSTKFFYSVYLQDNCQREVCYYS